MNRKRFLKSSRGFGSQRNQLSKTINRRATFEPLETRQLLAVTLAPIGAQTVETGAPLNLALTSTGTTNSVSYSVSVQNLTGSPQLTTTVPTGNTFLKMHVTDQAEGIDGDMVFELFGDLAPNTVQSITNLVNQHFYDNLTFHRIISGFMAQGGDPKGDGTGGPGFKSDNNFNANLQFTGSGLLAMANSGNDTDGSQFFITDAPYRSGDFKYSIFGMLVKGDDVRDKITNHVQTDNNDKPLNTVTITSATIITDNLDGVLRLTANATGTAAVTVTATDTITQATSVQTFNVTVAADTTNDPPFLGTINAVHTTVNTPVTFTLPATDVEGDPIYYDGIVNPSNSNLTVSVNHDTGSVTVTPAAGLAPGIYGLEFAVAPDSSFSTYDTQFVPLYVDPIPTLSVKLLAASDSGASNSDGITNRNNSTGKTLQFQVDGADAGMGVQVFADGTLIGQATVSGTSVVVTTNGTSVLTDGTHSITVKELLNNTTVASTAAISVTVDTTSPTFNFTPVRIAPVGVAYTCQVAVSGSSTGTTYELTQQPTGMTINSTTGLITWTPATDQTGIQHVTVKATDAAGNPVQTTFAINKPASVLTPASPSLGNTDEHTAKAVTLASFINNGAGTTKIEDAEPGVTVGGIALIGATGNGKWEYSTDGGATYHDVGTVSPAAALLLPKTAFLKFTPDNNNGGPATLVYRAWDAIVGTAGGTVDLSAPSAVGGVTPYSAATDTATLTVTDINDAPVLVAAHASIALANSTDTKTITLTNTFINHGPGTTAITDVDNGAAIGGIAVTGITGNGVWKYSLDGTTFQAMTLISSGSALLLKKDAVLSYTPSASETTTPTLTFHAWDTTSIDQNRADISHTGDVGNATAYSTETDTLSLVINSAPVLTPANPALGTTNENTPSTIIPLTGTGGFTNNTIADSDLGAVRGGIAVIGKTGNGTWQYALDGATFKAIPAVSDSAAFLLPSTASLKYVPDNNNGENPTITYRAWDTFTGKAEQTVDLSQSSAVGGLTAYSIATDKATLTVTPLNDAPVITAGVTPSLGSTVPATPKVINLSTFIDNNGTGTSHITDVDQLAVVGGIAINGAVGTGTWEYTLDGGTTYTAFGTVDSSHALLLPKDASVRFTPTGTTTQTATITYHAWDTTTGTAGNKVDLSSATGNATAFSTGTNTASLLVNNAPVLTTGTPTLAVLHDATPKLIAISSFINNVAGSPNVTDANTNAVVGGIAITAITGAGTWEYALSSTGTFKTLTATTATALLLPKDAVLRYKSDGTTGEKATFTYRAWDTTSGASEGRADLSQTSATGNATAFSLVSNTPTVLVEYTTLSNASINDNLAVGSTVGTFSSTPSAGNTFTYSLVSGAADNASFTLSGNTLKTAVKLNAGVKNSYSILVRTTDQLNNTFDKSYTITVVDVTTPTVTINKQAGQADPVHTGSIYYVVKFSEPVSDFTTADVALSGTASGATVKRVTGSGTTYEVLVGGMTKSGTVIANIAAGKAHDAAGNNSLAATTSTGNSVQYIKNWVTYGGTAKNDTFVLSPGAKAGTWKIKCNLATWTIPVTTEGITLDGLSGSDKVTIVGNASNESFDIGQKQVIFKSGNFRVETTNMEYTRCDGAGGGNSAVIRPGVSTQTYSLVNVKSQQFASSALQAASVPAAAASNAPALTQNALQPIIRAALARWKSAGMDAATLARLSQVQFVISDLPGAELGKAVGNQIYIDRNAARNGWFVDVTPNLDEEYLLSQSKQKKAIDPRALKHIDLLTVVEHELGHLAGFDDLDAMAENIMSGVLKTGIRRTPK
jgi:cyclophilin family peptidyl-prolyl cis-trans isomerase